MQQQKFSGICSAANCRRQGGKVLCLQRRGVGTKVKKTLKENFLGVKHSIFETINSAAVLLPPDFFSKLLSTTEAERMESTHTSMYATFHNF